MKMAKKREFIKINKKIKNNQSQKGNLKKVKNSLKI